MTHQVMSFRNRSQNRRAMAMRPVNRIKHVVDKQSALAAGGNGESSTLVSAVDAPVLANTAEVQTGSTVNAIYLKLEVTPTTSVSLANFYMYVVKNPGAELTLPEANVVGASDVKRYVIHQEMVMMQQQDKGNPRTVFNGVIMIPRGYRRMGPGDFLQVRVFTPGNGINYCFQCHYKEFR